MSRSEVIIVLHDLGLPDSMIGRLLQRSHTYVRKVLNEAGRGKWSDPRHVLESLPQEVRTAVEQLKSC